MELGPGPVRPSPTLRRGEPPVQRSRAAASPGPSTLQGLQGRTSRGNSDPWVVNMVSGSSASASMWFFRPNAKRILVLGGEAT